MVNNKDNKYIIVFLIIIILCIGFFAYQNFSSYSRLKAVFFDEKIEIQKELDQVIREYDELLIKKKDVSIELQIKRKNLIELRDTLITLKEHNYALFRKFRNKIAKLEAENKKLSFRIDSLEVENENLVAENANVNEQILITSQQAKNLENRYSSVKKSNQILLVTATKAKFLKMNNVSLQPLKIRNNGKLTETSRIHKIQAFKVNLEILENEFATAGKRKIYVQIHDQQKNIISPKGTVALASQEQIFYTDVFTIEYQNKHTPVTLLIELHKKDLFKQGIYTFNFYIEDRKGFTKKITFD